MSIKVKGEAKFGPRKILPLIAVLAPRMWTDAQFEVRGRLGCCCSLGSTQQEICEVFTLMVYRLFS